MSKIKLGFKRDSTPSSGRGTEFTVHPGSGAYVCRVLGIRYPNIHFSLPDAADHFIYGKARYRDEDIPADVCAYIYSDIEVLNIVYQLSAGKVGKLIHG